MLQALNMTAKTPGRPRRFSKKERAEQKRPSVRFTPEQAARAHGLATFEGKSISDLVIGLVDSAIATATPEDRSIIDRIAEKKLAADAAKAAAKPSGRRRK